MFASIHISYQIINTKKSHTSILFTPEEIICIFGAQQIYNFNSKNQMVNVLHITLFLSEFCGLRCGVIEFTYYMDTQVYSKYTVKLFLQLQFGYEQNIIDSIESFWDVRFEVRIFNMHRLDISVGINFNLAVDYGLIPNLLIVKCCRKKMIYMYSVLFIYCGWNLIANVGNLLNYGACSYTWAIFTINKARGGMFQIETVNRNVEKFSLSKKKSASLHKK